MAVTQTDTFRMWLDTVDDATAFAAIGVRLTRLAMGNLGDFKTFGGVIELRIDVGAGYRVYVMRDGADWLILSGGDKSSQKRDIPAEQTMAAAAKAIAKAARLENAKTDKPSGKTKGELKGERKR